MERGRQMVEVELGTFAREVTTVLEYHASMFRIQGLYFQIYNATWKNPVLNEQYFTENVKKAVFTLAYLFRAQCIDLCRKNYSYFKGSAASYGNFLMGYTLPGDRYFLRLLTWVAFAFEMTMCCYKQAFSESTLQPYLARNNRVTPQTYINRNERCLQDYPNIDVLFDRERKTEWWEEIQESANHIAAFHDTLVKAIVKHCPERDILQLLQVVLKKVLKLQECKLRMTEIILLRDYPGNECNRTTKLQPLLEHHLERIALGNTVVRKDECAIKPRLSSKINSERESNSRGNAQMVCQPSTSSVVCNANVPRSNMLGDEQHFQFDFYKNSAFVISDSKLERLKKARNPGKRDIKIYFSHKEVIGKVENLYTILEENAKKDNSLRISDKLLLVNSRDDVDKEHGNPIIVMDSSSEEEDDAFDSRQISFMGDVLKKWKELSVDDVEVMNIGLNSQIWEAAQQ